MSGTEYGQAFALWRDTAARPWRDYSRHAFVEALRDGTLPRSAFLNYLRQDYLFLIHFARAWALAAAKAETLEEMKAAAATVHALVHHEMQLHIATCAGEGISQAELEATPEAAENLAYTRYVLEAGYSGDLKQWTGHVCRRHEVRLGAISNALSALTKQNQVGKRDGKSVPA